MLLETIKVIALLCQIPSGDQSVKMTELLQADCQAAYIRCLNEDKKTLDQCIEERFYDVLTRP